MRADRRESCCAGETIAAHSVKHLCHEESAQEDTFVCRRKTRTKMLCTGISQTLIYRLPSLYLPSLPDEGFLSWDGAPYQCISRLFCIYFR